MEKLAAGLEQIKKMRPGDLPPKEQHELMNVVVMLTHVLGDLKAKNIRFKRPYQRIERQQA